MKQETLLATQLMKQKFKNVDLSAPVDSKTNPTNYKP